MIVSHAHRYLFFAVPKTATHAVREVLRSSLFEQDWEQQALDSKRGQQHLPIAELASIGHGHIDAIAAQTYLETSIWNDYFKVAFVRNPFDRFVSACAFLNRSNPEFAEQPTQWMKHAIRRPQFQQRILIRPQSRQLCDKQGELKMDFVGRYESLQESLDQLLQLLNLPSQQLVRRNASKHKDYQDYYDAELEQQVRAFYQKDLELFSYQF